MKLGITSVALLAAIVMSGSALAGGSHGKKSGDCNGVHNCNTNKTYNTDNSRTTNNTAKGGHGGNGTGVGVGIGQGGNATANGGKATSTSRASGGSVNGSGNSSSSSGLTNSGNSSTRVNASSSNHNNVSSTNHGGSVGNVGMTANMQSGDVGVETGDITTNVDAGDTTYNDGSSVNVDASDNSVYHAQRRNPVNTAYAAPLVAGDDTCMGSTSAGGQGITFGLSFATTWKDKDCIIRKDARFLQNAQRENIALSLMCSKPSVLAAVKRAGTDAEKRACGLVEGAPRDVAPATLVPPSSSTNGERG